MIIRSRTYKTSTLYFDNLLRRMSKKAKKTCSLSNGTHYISNDMYHQAKHGYLSVQHINVKVSSKNDECIVTRHTIIIEIDDRNEQTRIDNAIDAFNTSIRNDESISKSIEYLRFHTF